MLVGQGGNKLFLHATYFHSRGIIKKKRQVEGRPLCIPSDHIPLASLWRCVEGEMMS